jgi:hypothetical protein
LKDFFIRIVNIMITNTLSVCLSVCLSVVKSSNLLLCITLYPSDYADHTSRFERDSTVFFFAMSRRFSKNVIFVPFFIKTLNYA